MYTAARFALILSVVLASGACGSSADDSTRLAVESYDNPDDAYFLALAKGALTGTVSEDMACFWLATEPGEGAYVKWPEGYYALDDPLRILNPAGDVVGESGEPIQLGGGQFEGAGECGGVPYDRVWRASV